MERQMNIRHSMFFEAKDNICTALEENDVYQYGWEVVLKVVEWKF